MTTASRAVRYARTVAHLRPAQVAHRARLRALRPLVARLPESVWASQSGAAGWPPAYVPLDGREAAGGSASPEDNVAGTFRFLEETRSLGQPPDWAQAGASHLWRFHLHYFEWAWAFASCPDRTWARSAFADLWRSWRSATRVGRGDAWSPYVASLRAWALCGLFDPLVRGSAIETEMVRHLAAHGRFLRAHLEYDVGGNHLVKNLKALIGLGVFLAEARLVDIGVRALARQLAVQVLSDGGHYERSPSYHCQVLGDLLDVSELTDSAGMRPVDGIAEAIAGMRRWLGAMVLPDGDVALFNDCTLVGRERLASVGPTPPALGSGITVLQPSGYVVARTGRMHLVVDVGPPCPPDLPAHAHADSLSFELAVDGQRLVVDTGTSTYEAGGRRQFERSTSAHNTVEVDGGDSTEVWGTFRAARLARPTLEPVVVGDDGVTIRASHDGYRRLSGRPVHQRTWHLGDDTLVVSDQVTGSAAHRVVARLHIAPQVLVERCDENSVTAGPVSVSMTGDLAIDTSEVATGFGRRAAATVLSVSSEAMLPASITTTVTLCDTGGAG